jgi:YegS/Rv2252/BmrU family lipid kinase
MLPKLEKALAGRGLSAAIHQTRGPGHATDLARNAATGGASLIIVAGGDGTIHEVANGLVALDGEIPPIGIIPVGTGNDFFRMLGGSKAPGAALDEILAGAVRRFEVGRVRYNGTESVFVNLLGLGVDVEVLRKRAEFPRLKGLTQYLVALVSALTSFRPVSVKVDFEGSEGSGEKSFVENRTILIAVTVGPSVGGGFLLNPDASPLDGLLDLFFVEPLGMLKLARYIPRVIRGTHRGLPELIQRRITRAVIERSDGKPFFFEMDGEGMPDPVDRLELEVCPELLPVLVPRRDP